MKKRNVFVRAKQLPGENDNMNTFVSNILHNWKTYFVPYLLALLEAKNMTSEFSLSIGIVSSSPFSNVPGQKELNVCVLNV